MLRRHNRLLVAIFVVGDFTAAVAAFTLAYLLRFNTGLLPLSQPPPPFLRYVAIAPFIALLVVLAYQLQGLYRLRRPADVRTLPFGPPGDYEGVACTGTDYWVLRSDGALLRLTPAGERLTIAATHRLPADCEYEGLCHDSAKHRLLILPKRAISDGKRERGLRRVFAFDLRGDVVVASPVLTLNVDTLVDEAQARGMQVPTKTTKKGKERAVLKLFGSELLAVPGTGELLVLSAADHLLLRVGSDGALLGTCALDPDALPQPEAMTLLADGRLLVASEGVDGPATICVVTGWR
jgi:hypothetical protein